MKVRKSMTVDEQVWSLFEQICTQMEKNWGVSISPSQLLESMIMGWCKQNKELI